MLDVVELNPGDAEAYGLFPLTNVLLNPCVAQCSTFAPTFRRLGTYLPFALAEIATYASRSAPTVATHHAVSRLRTST
jgi:hypothetical protein